MIIVKHAGLGCYRLVSNSLKAFNPISCRFYSEFNGSCTLYLLRRECWLIMDGSNLLGLLFINSANHQVYYIPSSEKPLSVMGLSFLIKKYIRPTGYTLKLTYSSAGFKAASTYMNVKPIANLKHMCSSICSLPLTKPILPEGFEILPMKKGEEKIRVELQNSIFGGNKNRIPLTVEEVKDEEKQRGYIGSMCYILKINNKPSGYGQIMISNGVYSLINFGILPSYRGQGLGDFFLKYILSQCKQCGIESLQLTVDNNNPAALALYKKNGFIQLYNTAELVF